MWCYELSLARIRYMQKVLEEKHGIKGVVAGRYIEAGYNVVFDFKTPHGTLDIVATKGGDRVAIDVVWESKEVSSSDIENLVNKAKSINARPVLVLYGDGPRITDEVKRKAQEMKVIVKRIRSRD